MGVTCFTIPIIAEESDGQVEQNEDPSSQNTDQAPETGLTSLTSFYKSYAIDIYCVGFFFLEHQRSLA